MPALPASEANTTTQEQQNALIDNELHFILVNRYASIERGWI